MDMHSQKLDPNFFKFNYINMEIMWLFSKVILPLIRVKNSSCFSFPAAMSIFKASSKVKVILSFSYNPLTAYLNTSYVMYSMMLVIRFWVIGDFVDL